MSAQPDFIQPTEALFDPTHLASSQEMRFLEILAQSNSATEATELFLDEFPHLEHAAIAHLRRAEGTIGSIRARSLTANKFEDPETESLAIYAASVQSSGLQAARRSRRFLDAAAERETALKREAAEYSAFVSEPAAAEAALQEAYGKRTWSGLSDNEREQITAEFVANARRSLEITPLLVSELHRAVRIEMEARAALEAYQRMVRKDEEQALVAARGAAVDAANRFDMGVRMNRPLSATLVAEIAQEQREIEAEATRSYQEAVDNNPVVKGLRGAKKVMDKPVHLPGQRRR